MHFSQSPFYIPSFRSGPLRVLRYGPNKMWLKKANKKKKIDKNNIMSLLEGET